MDLWLHWLFLPRYVTVASHAFVVLTHSPSPQHYTLNVDPNDADAALAAIVIGRSTFAALYIDALSLIVCLA